MRKLILLISLLLAGCSSFFLAKYDTSEHSIVNEISTLAQLNKKNCNDSVYMKKVANDLYFKTILLKNLSSGFKYNDDAIKAEDNLSKIAEGLVNRYATDDDVSALYCELKLTAIQDTSVAIQRVIARKPR
jgi:hypothetical protein